jgi:hypothetical protein
MQVQPHDPAGRALSYDAGRTEADLVRDVGPPTRQRRVGDGTHVDVCKKPATRELTYEVQTVGFSKFVLDAFGMSTGEFTIVCVDKDGRITDNAQVIVH